MLEKSKFRPVIVFWFLISINPFYYLIDIPLFKTGCIHNEEATGFYFKRRWQPAYIFSREAALVLQIKDNKKISSNG